MNRGIFEFLFKAAHENPFLDWLIVFFATYLPYILGIAFLALLFRFHRDWRKRVFVVIEAVLVSILSRGIVAEILHFLYLSPRPPAALGVNSLIFVPGNSFPSGHTSLLFGLATVVFYMNRRWGMWFFGLAFLNGLSRVVAGVHWPFDILGGAGVGIASGFLVHLLMRPHFGKFQSEN